MKQNRYNYGHLQNRKKRVISDQKENMITNDIDSNYIPPYGSSS